MLYVRSVSSQVVLDERIKKLRQVRHVGSLVCWHIRGFDHQFSYHVVTITALTFADA
jgi:hypothetical protein